MSHGAQGQDRPQRPVLAARRAAALQRRPRHLQGPAAGHRQRASVWHWDNRAARPHDSTIFFTDRSLYRPGQTIQYKGHLHPRRPGGATTTRCWPTRALTVVFTDANGKEIARRKHRTNDYGSFSGSFTAPRDRLMGRMTIRVEGEPRRRDQRQRRGIQAAEVPGDPRRAEDGGQAGRQGEHDRQGHGLHRRGGRRGKVRYRVVRQVRYPDWWGWCFWWRRAADRQPGDRPRHGRDRRRRQLHRRVHGQARPGGAGEGRADVRVRGLGRRDRHHRRDPLGAAERPAWATRPCRRRSPRRSGWRTRSRSRSRSPRRRSTARASRPRARCKIYRLKQPEKVVRPSLFQQSHRCRSTGRCGRSGKAATAEPCHGRRRSPIRPIPTPGSWARWWSKEGLTTDAAGKADATRPSLAGGAYRAKFETQDRFGKKVVAWLPLMVLEPEAKTLPIKIPNLVAAPKWTLEPGEEFMALWGTGYEQGRAFMEIEHRNKIAQELLDRAGRHPAAGQAGGDRGHARRLHAARDHGPREPGLPHLPQGRGALDQQEAQA